MTTLEKANGKVVGEKKRNPFISFFIRLVKEKPLGTIGGIMVLGMLITGIFADVIAPYGMNEQHLADRLLMPSFKYILGTDGVGRDLFTRIVYGARVSMIVGLSATSISVAISTLIGITSGYFGGRYDTIMQRFVDAWMCFPALFLTLSLMAVVGRGMLQVIIVLGLQRGVAGSRVVRSAVMGIRQNVYIDAAKAIGVQPTSIILRHILPNIIPTIIVLFSIGLGQAILAEATLSFLGMGVPPPAPSWGGMLSGSGVMYLYRHPIMCIWPGLALALVVYGVNMFGDALRDLLDPRLVGGLGRYGGTRVKKATDKIRGQK